MIVINRPEDCCGCSACEQVCPKRCISLVEDEKGFLYPEVNKDLCIDCGLCQKSCPVLIPKENRSPITAYASKNPDEDIRANSSSGGIFTLIAEKVISQKGVVFGAKFNSQWMVEHDYTENVDGLKDFRGSKYVQSDTNCFAKVKIFLDGGRLVLFTGTPCQIAGLKSYLKKPYDNLFTMDVACHGTASPKIWGQWLEKTVRDNKINSIKSISFRHKYPTAKNYSFCIESDNDTFVLQRKDNPYMMGYLNNLFLRPICFECPFKGGFMSDITLTDFWGLKSSHPEFEDNKGISAVVINTVRGKKIFDSIKSNSIEVQYKDVLKGNPILERSVEKSNDTDRFWYVYNIQGITALKIMYDRIIKRNRIMYPITFAKKVVKRIFKS